MHQLDREEVFAYDGVLEAGVFVYLVGQIGPVPWGYVDRDRIDVVE